MTAYQKPLEHNGFSSSAEQEAETWSSLAAKPLARISLQSNLSLKGSVVLTSAMYQVFIALTFQAHGR